MADQDAPTPSGPAAIPVAPGPDETKIATLLAPTILLLTISTILVGMRLYSRIVPVVNLGLDDAAAVLAAISSALQITLLYAGIPHGLGRHFFYLDDHEKIMANKYVLVSQFPWGWGVCFAKISIAFLLLRFKKTKTWKIFLWFMIFVQFVLAALANIIQLVQCKPIAAQWNPFIPGAVCWDPKVAQKGVFVMGSISVLSDIILAAIPITFLKDIQRPLREKMVLGLLMGLGVFTAATVIVKMKFVGNFGDSTDPTWDVIDLATWSCVEGQIGIVAACVPTLKAPFEGILRRFGLLTRRTNDKSGYINASGERSRAYYLSNMSGAGGNKSRSEQANKTALSAHASEQSILPQPDPKEAF